MRRLQGFSIHNSDRTQRDAVDPESEPADAARIRRFVASRLSRTPICWVARPVCQGTAERLEETRQLRTNSQHGRISYPDKLWSLMLAAFVLLLVPNLASAAGKNAADHDLLTPPLAGDKPVAVTVGMYLLNLAAVDEVKETFQVDGYLTATWQDDRLKHSPAAGSALRPKTYREDQVWYPRLSMLNAAEPRSSFDVTIRTEPDGKTTYMERFVVNLSTQFDVGRFPFDSQNLIIDLQPTLADRELMVLASKPSLLQLNRAEYVGMAQWDIRGLIQQASEETIDGTTDRISQVRITIHVQRRFGFYIWKVFIPLLLMVAVSWTIFWMNLDDFGNQILVAITTILTVIAFAFSIESNLPKVPYVTYIDAFFLCCYFFVFFTVLELMAVNMVLRRKGRDAAIRIRHFAQWLVPTVFIIFNAFLIPYFFLD
jgi:hypothetical protein